MRDENGNYSWCAFDPALWTHYHHAGVQERYYRVRPWSSGYERFEPRWWVKVVNFLIGAK